MGLLSELGLNLTPQKERMTLLPTTTVAAASYSTACLLREAARWPPSYLQVCSLCLQVCRSACCLLLSTLETSTRADSSHPPASCLLQQGKRGEVAIDIQQSRAFSLDSQG